MGYQINTNKRYQVTFYDNMTSRTSSNIHIIIEFTNANKLNDDYSYSEYDSYECCCIGDDGESLYKCILHVQEDTFDCVLELISDDSDITEKLVVKDLTVLS